MGLRDYFKPVSTWTADQVREFMKGKDPDAYNLIDVRQPLEYQQEHLPGARLIPMSELAATLPELDRDKATIAY